MLDLLDLILQSGCWPIAPALGAGGIWLGTASNDGVRLNDTDPTSGAAAFDTVMAMHEALLSFDGKPLDSMEHGAYLADYFLLFGPSGVGQTRGMRPFGRIIKFHFWPIFQTVVG